MPGNLAIVRQPLNPKGFREFPVDPGAITAAAGYSRDRTTLSVPGRLFRCVKLVIRNNSASDVTVTINEQAYIVFAGATDILNPGLTRIDGYSITPDADTAAGEVLVVEQCRPWTGWDPNRQEE